MTDAKTPFLTHAINLDEGVPLVCEDRDKGQTLRLVEVNGRPVITYSFSSDGDVFEFVLNESEATELTEWRNNGRRTSYWDWPGWDAVRQRRKFF